MAQRFYHDGRKRLLDLTIVISLLPFWLPVFGVLVLLLRATQGRPVLYRQLRAGLKGQPFTIYKFRTMTEARDAAGQLLPDEQRLTRFGRFVRLMSLDELPQLLNVLRGDMSLIGPRPLLIEYLGRYTPEQRRRHEVRPGITGLAQINGRQAIPFSERLRLDVQYVDNLSFSLDMRILFRTVVRVFSSDGVVLKQTLAEVDNIGLSRDLHPTAGYEQGAATKTDCDDKRKVA
jgi:lipopolysaccharide/colanic/teichoic acid biosynthesis glycosyltransferase